MIEIQPQSGLHQETSSRNCFASKFGLCTILILFLALGWAGRPLSATPKKPAKPQHSAASKKAGATAKHPAHKGGKATATHSKSKPARGRQAASRHNAAPYHPRYSVAKPIHQAPLPQETAPAPAATYPTDDSLLAEPRGQPLQYSHALDAFFRALAQLPKPGGASAASQSADASAESIVRAMQFGDSHTAADLFTGEMRAQLQARFGNGGLGFQYPGRPFAGYRLLGSTRSQTSGWVTQGNHFNNLGDGDTGLGGIAISTSRPGESVFLTTTCETLQVQYLRQPGGGSLDFSDNGLPVSEIKTSTEMGNGTDGQAGTDSAASPSRSAGTFTYSCTPGEHEFQLITMESAPVRLLGLVTEQPGVTYEAMGINGAVAPLMLRWNQQLFADYLGQRNPNLIVLAYGTNEAAGDGSRNPEYVAAFHELLQNLHRIAPGASILVLGPYDRALRVGRGRRAKWRTSTAIDRIIADQRDACRVYNCAFYDQRERMGGPGVMSHWVANGLAQGDHTHLTGTGYRVLADALYRDLMAVYNTYLQSAASSNRIVPSRPTSPTKPSVQPAS